MTAAGSAVTPAHLSSSISCHCPHPCFFSYHLRSNAGAGRNPFALASPFARIISLSLPHLTCLLVTCSSGSPCGISPRKPRWHVSSPAGWLTRPLLACSYPFLGIPSVVLSPSTPSCSFKKAGTCDLCNSSASCTPGALYLAVKRMSQKLTLKGS